MDSNSFNPLDWLASSVNKKVANNFVNGQKKSGQVINLKNGADKILHARDNNDPRAELLTLINQLVYFNINITESYRDWLRVGFALAWELGQEGRDAFHQLSAQSAKYDPQECERKWNEVLRTANGSSTRSTIFWLAQQAGIDVAAL